MSVVRTFWISVVLVLLSSAALAGQTPQGDPLSIFLDEYASFASVGQFFAGPLAGNQQAITSLQVTNRDPNQPECGIGVFLHRGRDTFIPTDFPVLINDTEGPFASATIPRGGVMRFDLTSSELVQGAIALGFRTLAPGACSPDSFRVATTFFTVDNVELVIKSSGAGANPSPNLSEAFSIAANNAGTWLCTGFCVAVSTTEGAGIAQVRQRLAIAVSSLTPGQPAPEGTRLQIHLFDALGAPFGDPDFDFGQVVDGSHMTFFLGQRATRFAGAGTMVICLEGPDPEYKMDLTVIRVNQIRGGRVQFDQAIFSDGFESGDLSAWTTGGN